MEFFIQALWPIFLAFVRQALVSAGVLTAVTGLGITGEVWTQVVGAIMAVLGLFWSAKDKANTARVLSNVKGQTTAEHTVK